MTAAPPPPGEITPESLLQLNFSFAASRILAAGVQLGLFSLLAGGPASAGDVAGKAGTAERGTAMLLDALVGLGLLTKPGGRYQLTPATARYLVRDSADYMGAFLENDSIWESWGRLAETVRTGRPPRQLESEAEAEKFFPGLIRTLHVLNREPARKAAAALGAGTTRRSLNVLDVACGSGVWGIAVAEADAQARLTFQDFPGVLEHTKKYVHRHGLDARSDYLPGDLKRVDFGAARYEVALLGNIVHSEGEPSSRDLFRRLHRALKPGGQIVIVDMVPNEERTGPPYPLIFAVNMLVNTREGGTYTLGEYTRWLNDAGFPKVTTADIGSHSPLVIGTKS